MNQHDLGYNKLFSHARMIQDLVAGFIQEEWVAGLGFATLKRVYPILRDIEMVTCAGEAAIFNPIDEITLQPEG